MNTSVGFLDRQTRGRRRALALAALVLVASAGPPAAMAAYTASQNRFGYAREYADPSWDGIYLRKRWYHPALPSFLSRDPVQQINHYGYAGGNPLMRIDPSGMSYRSFQRGLAHYTSGIQGHFRRFFFSPFLGPLQLIAQPGAFWQTVRHNRGETDIFLFGGIAAELATMGRVPLTNWVLPEVAFGRRILGEAVLGTAQSALASTDRNLRHFNARSFVAGLEYTFGAETVCRFGAGIGYDPFHLGATDVDAMVAARLPASPHSGFMLLYRARLPFLPIVWNTPWLEMANIGIYHELLIGVGRENFLWTQALADGSYEVEARRYSTAFSQAQTIAEQGSNLRLQFVGVVDRDELIGASRANPRNLMTKAEAEQGGATVPRAPYDPFNNNCHTHVHAVLKLLRTM